MKNIISLIKKYTLALLLLALAMHTQARQAVVVDDSISISGKVYFVTGEPMEGVELTFNVDGEMTSVLTDSQGNYTVNDIDTDASSITYMITKDVPNDGGLSVDDLDLTRDWVLQISTNFLPYNLLAMDINNSGSVTTLDIVLIMRIILDLEDDLGGWNFVSAYTQFPDPLNPWNSFTPEVIPVGNLESDLTDVDFVGFKYGDINQDVDPNE